MDEYLLFVLKSIWLFILGAALAIIGLLCLIYRPDMGSNSFIIMLMGLFFTGAGSIYGKKKLGYGESLVSVSSERQKNLKFSEREGQGPMERFSFMKRERETEFPWEKRDPRRFFSRPETSGDSAEKQEEILEMAEDSMGPGEPGRPEERPTVQASEEAEKEQVKPMETSAPAAPTSGKAGKIIKIVVCPSCGAENEPGDKFCFNCGFNIRDYEKKAKKSKRGKTRGAPASGKKPNSGSKKPSPASSRKSKSVPESKTKTPELSVSASRQ